MPVQLPFEQPLVSLLEQLPQLRELAAERPEFAAELRDLEARAAELARESLRALAPIEKVQLARHPQRPYTLDYLKELVPDFLELHGDRHFADDAAIVGGLGTFRGRSVVVVGHQKGRTTKDNVKRNFGMPYPEGYRKAIRLYRLAERFRLPVLTFIDTPGAYCGIGAEERGQSEAIAAAIETLAELRVPVIASVIGEGGSGGALALGVANRVLMFEFSYYSVISPEGCAGILWKDRNKASVAAERLRITAQDLLDLKVIDEIVAEPPGGAHQAPAAAAVILGDAIERHLGELSPLAPDELEAQRYARFRSIGAWETAG